MCMQNIINKSSIIYINLPLFSTVVPAIIFVFLSCRPFVAITTFSTGLVGCWKINANKINWREHIQRMDDNKLPKIILNYKPEGRRNIGRPKKGFGKMISRRNEQAKGPKPFSWWWWKRVSWKSQAMQLSTYEIKWKFCLKAVNQLKGDIFVAIIGLLEITEIYDSINLASGESISSGGTFRAKKLLFLSVCYESALLASPTLNPY